jgi:hypothetical protein
MAAQPVSVVRAIFEFLVPIIVAMYAAILLFSAPAPSTAAPTRIQEGKAMVRKENQTQRGDCHSRISKSAAGKARQSHPASGVQTVDGRRSQPPFPKATAGWSPQRLGNKPRIRSPEVRFNKALCLFFLSVVHATVAAGTWAWFSLLDAVRVRWLLLFDPCV